MNWHRRYLQQASWTRDLRNYLLQQAGTATAERVLEVGCGTGAILHDTARNSPRTGNMAFTLHGLDIEVAALGESRLHEPSAHLTRGDALALPYADRVFHITFCHFLLMWVRDPARCLREMRRVTRPSGHILALAEPDYSARIDKPDELAPLGMWQERSLADQGANTTIGAGLADLFRESGMIPIESGTIAQWPARTTEEADFAGDWDVLRQDLTGRIPDAELDRMMRLDAYARQRGQRILHVPVYFVHAQV